MRTTTIHLCQRDLGRLVSGDESPCKFKATRSRLPHPKLKGPITLVDVMRRETMQLSMPFER